MVEIRELSDGQSRVPNEKCIVRIKQITNAMRIQRLFGCFFSYLFRWQFRIARYLSYRQSGDYVCTRQHILTRLHHSKGARKWFLVELDAHLN